MRAVYAASAERTPPSAPAFQPTQLLRALGRRALRVPLVVKMLGANALLVLAVLAVGVPSAGPSRLALLGAALVASLALNAILVRLALLPLDELERVARRVSEGDFSARVESLPIADAQIRRLSDAFNRLLGRVAVDRARIRHLVRASLHAREMERAAVAHQLRESTAQQLSALTLQVRAAMQRSSDAEIAPMLRAAHEIASGMAEEVRHIADAVYPGLLGRFGLSPALEGIGRRAREWKGLAVTVDSALCERGLPLGLTTALYAVAEEAVRNAQQHAGARCVRIALRCAGNDVELRVEDDGTGFDPESAEREFGGIGLFRARELLAQIGGELRIVSAPGRGTTLIATARVDD